MTKTESHTDFNPFNMLSTIVQEPKASYNVGYGNVNFSGESTPYTLGTPLEFDLDYHALRARAWESFIKSDVIQNAIRKYVLWINGKGLKLQSDPLTNSTSKQDFISQVESQFRLYSNINESTYNNNQNLHELINEGTKTALLSGDVLCIARYERGIPTLEIKDGCFVQSPIGSDYDRDASKRGNTIKQGVELDKNGTHIAYYVKSDDFTYTRILARGKKTGRKQAWLYYGLKHKLTDVRGMSLLTTVLETVKQLDRYKSATVGNAEENSKIPFVIEHDQHSTGENPMVNQLAQSFSKGKGIAPETGGYDDISNVKSKIATTTGKQVYNMPIGSSLKRNDFESDINFSDFWGINEDIVYYTIGIPPEIARDRYEGSYSSSRASLKSWEYKMNVDRERLPINQCYRPFYEFWLDINIINQNINSAEYLQALLNNNIMQLASWRRARFIGASVPHIDPLKEVKASREKLGVKFDNIPLSTMDTETELLNTGDSDTIITKSEEELKRAEFFNQNTVDNG